MDFELSADQQALREAARQLLDGTASPAGVRAHMASGRPHDSALWSAMVAQGWCRIAVPEAEGGLGLGWVEAAVLMEEIGGHAAPAPLTPALVALAALGGRPQSAELVSRLMSGSAMAAVAWSSSEEALAQSADALRLTGRLGPVEGACIADAAVVVVPAAVYLVDLAATGRPVAEPAMDLTRSLSWLSLDSTPAVRLGGPELSSRLTALGALLAAADLLGGAARVLEMATQYAKDRIQFGVPIGSFQAVKHRCADMLVDVEGMRSATWYAAWALTTSEPGWELAASTAKVWCADASKRVMASGLQVHGGIGFTWEHDLHLYIKRAQFSQLDYGDAAHHRTLIADGLKQAVAAGRSVM
ncbi:MAG TPA: acyl-CoA dehydrogenase family protein [Acidimicrobiales bacterium]|nr:acyl-CoA dehydrogenase family protein [Acidimicrobiales bacterium]